MQRIYPGKNEFSKLSEQYNVIPVYMELQGDMYTAISLFLKMRSGPFQFLLESAVSGEYMGRYSFMGNSHRALLCKNNIIRHIDGDDEIKNVQLDNPLEYVRDYFNQMVPYQHADLPPFVNGAVGYIGYDSVKYFEAIDFQEEDVLGVNDFELILTDTIIIYDNLKHKLIIVNSPVVSQDKTADDIYDEACGKVEAMADLLLGKEGTLVPLKVQRENGRLKYKSNFSKDRYETAVEKAKEYIYAGDAFQLVLSQRLKVSVEGDAFNLYRSLRIVNPSPYMFYLRCSNAEIIGSSPEIHVQLQGGMVNIRPIAGTRPRGKTPEEDRINEEELMADEKERAEHIMLVDLARNDIGRVCTGGTVRVEDLEIVEYYSHVMHIVSNVRGKLSPEYDMFSLIEASFPAGTVSGAPKIRAMEIISELEPERRGIYSGLIGYMSFNGNFDSCISIRTMIVKDGILYLQAGAGIVADSVPEREYYETIHKMKALTKAIESIEEFK